MSVSQPFLWLELFPPNKMQPLPAAKTNISEILSQMYLDLVFFFDLRKMLVCRQSLVKITNTKFS
jgi:hypothetical protein